MPIATGLTLTDGDYLTSDDGGRIATISRPNISRFTTWREAVARVRAPPRGDTYERAFFVTPDVLRLYLNVSGGLKIAELTDVRTRGLRDTGFIAVAGCLFLYSDPSAAHMLVASARRHAHAERCAHRRSDTRSLSTSHRTKPRATCATDVSRSSRAGFRDGPAHPRRRRHAAARHPPRREKVDDLRRRRRYARRSFTTSTSASGQRMLEAINIDRGVVEHREPVRDWVPSGVIRTRPPIQPLREVFYTDDKGHIVAWNPATGAKRKLIRAAEK